MAQVITEALLQNIISTDYIKSTGESPEDFTAHITSRVSRTGHTFVASAVGAGSVARAQEGATSAFDSCRSYAQKRIKSMLDSGVPASVIAGIQPNMTYDAYLALTPPTITDSEITNLCNPVASSLITYGATAELTTKPSTVSEAVTSYGIGVDMNGAGTAEAEAKAAAISTMKGYEAYARRMYAFAYFLSVSPLELVP